GLTIAHAKGGVVNYGAIKIVNCTISDCNRKGVPGGSDGTGGGIFNDGTAELINSSILRNSAHAYVTFDFGIRAYGGGIFNSGTLTMSGTGVYNNSVDYGAGAGIFNSGILN